MNVLQTIYEDYNSNGYVTVPKQNIYKDKDGFLNEIAFRDFIARLAKENECYLACINVDLRASNASQGYAFGTRVLRTAYLQLQDFVHIFRIGGEKFNLVIEKENLENAKKMLDSDVKELFSIYYGVITDEFLTADNYEELRKRGVEAMYRHKADCTGKDISEVRDDKIVGDKGNTPPELQETDTHKFRETMWYGTIAFTEKEPLSKEVIVYVFPTEYKDKMMSAHQIVVVDDYVNTVVFTGNDVRFGFDGIRYNVNSRFDNDGKLTIMCFKDKKSNGECGMIIHSHEGSCLPANFGKRIGNGCEIYPIKKIATGAYSYVLWDKQNNKATYNETGLVEMKGKKYAVFADENGIDLIAQ